MNKNLFNDTFKKTYDEKLKNLCNIIKPLLDKKACCTCDNSCSKIDYMHSYRTTTSFCKILHKNVDYKTQKEMNCKKYSCKYDNAEDYILNKIEENNDDTRETTEA